VCVWTFPQSLVRVEAAEVEMEECLEVAEEHEQVLLERLAAEQQEQKSEHSKQLHLQRLCRVDSDTDSLCLDPSRMGTPTDTDRPHTPPLPSSFHPSSSPLSVSNDPPSQHTHPHPHPHTSTLTNNQPQNHPEPSSPNNPTDPSPQPPNYATNPSPLNPSFHRGLSPAPDHRPSSESTWSNAAAAAAAAAATAAHNRYGACCVVHVCLLLLLQFITGLERVVLCMCACCCCCCCS